MAQRNRSTGRAPKYDYSEGRVLPAAAHCKSLAELARVLEIPPTTFRMAMEQYPELKAKVLVAMKGKEAVAVEPMADALHKKLVRGSKVKSFEVDELADELDTSPKRIRGALDVLRARGIRIPEESDDHRIQLQKIVPTKTTMHQSTALLEGDTVRIGIVSDTHLSSNEEALEELHVAYDMFVEEGITEVLHAGDWTCGRGIYRTQDMEIKNHTFETQVDYMVTNYPQRDSIRTRGISGNHDIEGEFGKIGADPVMALALKRPDIDYLGPFSAWVELPNGANIHLLHGKGGASYAFSYKAQKLAEGYPQGRKPSILIPGHFHRSGHLDVRSIQVLFPGCFEWKTHLLERLGLNPSVGFWILNLTLGEDGSLVRFVPEWMPFYAGRTVSS